MKTRRNQFPLLKPFLSLDIELYKGNKTSFLFNCKFNKDLNADNELYENDLKLKMEYGHDEK